MSAGHSGKNLVGDEVNVLGAIHSDQFSVSLSDYCVGLRQSWHSHEQPILTLILAGYAREQVGCEDVTINPLQVGLKPAGLRHTDHFWPNGVRALRISLSSALISPLLDLLPSNKKRLESQQDAIVALIHSAFDALSFRLIAVDEFSPASANVNGVLPEEWNENGPGNYTLRYRHEQSSLEFIIKVIKLGSRTLINAIAVEVCDHHLFY